MTHYTVSERHDREEQNLIASISAIGRGASFSRREMVVARRLARVGKVRITRQVYADGTSNTWVTLVR